MTTTDVLLAVDAGTSTIKAVAFGIDGTELAVATRETETLRPEPGHVEQDPVAVWERTAAALRDVTGSLPDGAEPIGVSVTGQGDGLWAITDDGDPAGNAMLWSDSRAAGILEEWTETGALDAVVEQCGSAPYPGMSLPILAWVAREQPARFDRIDTILSAKDWLKYELTGERTLDHTEATVPYLDKTTERYDPAVFEAVDLPEAESMLPRLAEPTEVVGTVTDAAAEATGVPSGVPVVSGVFEPGRVCVGLVPAEAAAGCRPAAATATRRASCDPLPVPAYLGRSLVPATALLELHWYSDVSIHSARGLTFSNSSSGSRGRM